MLVAALAAGEEGEEDEEEEDEEGKEGEREKLTMERERHTGHYGYPVMYSVATTAVGNKSRRLVTTGSVFFVQPPPPLLPLLLLLLLLPAWIQTIVVVDASPLHPTPLHKGESRLSFFVGSLRQRNLGVPRLDESARSVDTCLEIE